MSGGQDDPFQLSREIRKGMHDDHLPDYEIITGWLQRVPETWLPGLFFTSVRCVYSKACSFLVAWRKL